MSEATPATPAVPGRFAWQRWALGGVLATLVMDLLGTATRATGLTRGVPPELIAKWFKLAATGRVFVDDIRVAPGTAPSMAAFLAVHYTIGVVFALALAFLLRTLRIRRVPWWGAVCFGVLTTAAPAFLMFPGMGFGVFGVDGPTEWMLLRTSLVNHAYFGVGLAVAARIAQGPRSEASTA